MMMLLATMFVMAKVRVVITRHHHHHHHPAMILLVCCRLLHLVVPRDVSFFLTDSFSVFLLLPHILGNSIAAFGRLVSRALSF
jgi:hypothetical protein